jgi:hypothetical protein
MRRLNIGLVSAALMAVFYFGPAQAQNAGTVTAHAFAIGKGAGHSGYTSLLCDAAQLAVGQSSADPICKTITGDVTISAAGATAIGATKVKSSMLNADVFSTAHTWAGQQTFVAPVLGTPASGTLTNATGLPISTGVSGLGSGVATFLGTPSSANLKSAVTDETGSGALVFATSPTLVTPALGTPASAILTNATGLPISTGVSGLGSGVATFLATPSSANLRAALTDETGTGAAYFVGGALGTPSSGTATNLTGLPLTTGVTGNLPLANIATGVSDTVLGYWGSTAVSALAVNNCSNALTYSTSTHTFGCNSTAGTGTVTSVGLTNTYGLTVTSSPVTTSGNINAEVGLSSASAVLGSDVSLNSTSTYFDGPSMAQGSTGTWFACGTITLQDVSNSSSNINARLWDGTTVIASTVVTTQSGNPNARASVTLCGIKASPAGNIRISAKDTSATTGVIKANQSGDSKDGTIFGFRLN